MTNFNDKSTLGSRVSQASEELGNVAQSHQKWLAHLDSSIEAVNNDLKDRIREIRDRHRRARQEISNDLFALAQEVGYLPPPSYASIMTDNAAEADVLSSADAAHGISYFDHDDAAQPQQENAQPVHEMRKTA